MRILIVEDERTLCDTIARSLRNLAYSVDCCHDGQEALDLLNVEAFAAMAHNDHDGAAHVCGMCADELPGRLYGHALYGCHRQ